MQIFDKHPLEEYYPPPDYKACNVEETNETTSEGTTWSYVGMTLSLLNDLTTISRLTEEEEEEEEILNQPNTALLSVILTLGTFFIAYFLRIFRNSKFLGRSVGIYRRNTQTQLLEWLHAWSPWMQVTSQMFVLLGN